MPSFSLRFTRQASKDLQALQSNAKKLKKVRRALAKLEEDPRHPGLNSHKYATLQGPHGQDAWESYVENKTPAAWRIFWCYGPEPDQLTILAITKHP